MNVSIYKDKIIDMYCNKNLNTVEISKILGCSDSAVGKVLKQNNINRVHKPNELHLSENDILEICTKYQNGETTKQIGRNFNICDNSVSKILRRNNIQIRCAKRYSKVKNHDYFSNIDSADKAYFLGWMISDGSIVESKTRKNRQKVISIEIHNRDKYILDLFARYIDASEDIVKVFEKRNHCYIRFSSNKMADTLLQYGVVPRKSFITFLPQIEKNLMPHLIRGIFDGDGTIVVNKDKQAKVGFYGSKQLCNEISDFLHNELGLNKNKVSKSTCYHVWYGGRGVVSTLFDYLYKDCEDLYLRRKFVKFKKCV